VFRIFCFILVSIFIVKHPSHHATSAALDAFAWWHHHDNGIPQELHLDVTSGRSHKVAGAA
jgi:hypothetical protein